MITAIGIETSCDETAVAIVNSAKDILYHKTFSQLNHQLYGGVVPEVAAREHGLALPYILDEMFAASAVYRDRIDLIAATTGPGLAGGLMVGAIAGKAIALAFGKPFLAIDHLEGHALTARLTNNAKFPYLLLLISGGHCQIIIAKAVSNYQLLGTTRDDALGEAFDKVAKMLGLSYPGGPLLEALAVGGDKKRFQLPMPMCKEPSCDFSFSGLKTAVARRIQSHAGENIGSDMAASFQYIVANILKNRLANAMAIALKAGCKQLVVAGGVAANLYLKHELLEFASLYDLELLVPPPSMCTDNGAMIAWAGIEHYLIGCCDDESDCDIYSRQNQSK